MDEITVNQQNLPSTKRDQRRQEIKFKAKADNTLSMLKTNLRQFQAWCEANGMTPLPASTETVVDYLIHLSDQGKKVSTIQSASWAIGEAHKQAKQENPCSDVEVKNYIAGIKRELAEKKSDQARTEKKEALTVEDICRFRFENTIMGKRDKALLLMGAIGGFRRSELADMRVEDIEYDSKGFKVYLHHTKANTDATIQIVKGRRSNCCAVMALNEYLEAAGIVEGFVFRSIRKGDHLTEEGIGGKKGDRRNYGKTIARIVKKYVGQLDANIDEKSFGAHSLRAGCATYLLDKGVPAHTVQKHMRHANFNTTQGYNRNEVANDLEGVY